MPIRECEDCNVVKECTLYHYNGIGIIGVCEDCEGGPKDILREEEFLKDEEEERLWRNERLTA